MKTTLSFGSGRLCVSAGGRRGSVLVMSLIAVVVVSIITAGFLQLSTSVTRRQASVSQSRQAFYLAEAGLAEAYAGLAIAKTGNVGSPAAPAAFGNGLFWVEAEEQPDGKVVLESTGMIGAGRATLGMVCEPIERAISMLGVFANDDMRVNPDTLIDSFDSSQGTYADQVGTPTNNQALVGSNGDIDLGSGDMVFGDVVTGPTGSATLGSGAIVTGTVSARGSAAPLPPIEVPAIAKQAALSHSGAVPYVLAPGESGFDAITVATGATVIVEGPATLVLGDLTVERDGELAFDTTNGPVDVYVEGDVSLKADSLVSTSTERTSDVIVMVASPSSKSIDFGSNATFYGFIYAPDAIVKMSAKFEIFGGLVAKGVSLAAQGKLHMDVALDPTRDGIIPKMYSWRVVDIPAAVRADRTDPFRLLGVDAATLPTPSEAHGDQLLSVEYVDAGGLRSSFTGMESTFDWSDVSEVVSGTRDGTLFDAPDAGASQDPEGPQSPLIDLINSDMTSRELKVALMSATPIGDEVLIAALERDPPMEPRDIQQVIHENSPELGYPVVSDDVLLAAIAMPGMVSESLKLILKDHSPLSDTVLQTAIDSGIMITRDLNSLLSAQ